MTSIAIPTILSNPKLRLALIFLPNFAWFFAGFVQFSLRASRFRGALSPAARQQKPKIGDLWHQDIVIYLGAFGGALSVSVLDAGYQNLLQANVANLPLYLRLWGFAHASQGLVGWSRIKPSGRWDWSRYLGPITYVDTVLCLWDFTLAFWHR